jgi:hypothetical protein
VAEPQPGSETITVWIVPLETSPLKTIEKVFETPADVVNGWLMLPSVMVSVCPPTGLLIVTTAVDEYVLVAVWHNPTVIVGVATEQIGGATEQETGAVY